MKIDIYEDSRRNDIDYLQSNVGIARLLYRSPTLMEHIESRGDYDTLCCLLDLDEALDVLQPYEYELLRDVFIDNVPIESIISQDDTPAELIYSFIQHACCKLYHVMNGSSSASGAIQ